MPAFLDRIAISRGGERRECFCLDLSFLFDLDLVADSSWVKKIFQKCVQFNCQLPEALVAEAQSRAKESGRMRSRFCSSPCSPLPLLNSGPLLDLVTLSTLSRRLQALSPFDGVLLIALGPCSTATCTFGVATPSTHLNPLGDYWPLCTMVSLLHGLSRQKEGRFFSLAHKRMNGLQD